jgi:hypothetical protein
MPAIPDHRRLTSTHSLLVPRLSTPASSLSIPVLAHSLPVAGLSIPAPVHTAQAPGSGSSA